MKIHTTRNNTCVVGNTRAVMFVCHVPMHTYFMCIYHGLISLLLLFGSCQAFHIVGKVAGIGGSHGDEESG